MNGLQERIEDWAQTQKLLRPNGNIIKSLQERRKAIHFIRYGANVIIMHRELFIVKNCKEIMEKFLFERGLPLEPIKTKIKHTRKCFNGMRPGFDFLDFTIKQFDTTHKSAKNNKGEKIGYKLLIYPNKKSVDQHFFLVKNFLKKFRTAKQIYIIDILNTIIVRWVNYFKYSHFLTTKTASAMDRRLYLKLRSWAKKKLNAQTYKPGYKKFWHKVSGRLYFSFFNEKSDSYVKLSSYRKSAKSVSLVKYTKILGDSSVYDGKMNYWLKRAIPAESKTKRNSALMFAQKGRCTICGAIFKPGDIIETDHIILRSKGGKHEKTNLQLLHAHCHDSKTNFFTFFYKK